MVRYGILYEAQIMSGYSSVDNCVIVVSKSEEHCYYKFQCALFITPRLFEEMLRNSQAQALTVNNTEVKFSSPF